jgi:predicted metal-binding transcription factor (methanogenesis marker protein 9)
MELYNNKTINECTLIELTHIINKIKTNHDLTKNNINILLDEYDILEKKINEKLIELKEIENSYIESITELNNR